ncbi:LEM-3-like GIY-YIG domain-containing protein [Syntrophotalea acetylenica]|uniref:LEM-3-like GIY-YIG domain-containing protein n=1 Tax=Syntrophotalea acetylenica TaxID=29542 RepID=UPI002A362D4A|nr:hypothetical protein [Syntrophotalea acetylenica]MDY0262720.1 hypothetical protein [Syntrophotalea acetylenica]
MSLSIPPEVARHLGYYVYLYVDPRTDRPFYVGKGQGARILSHLSEEGETEKVKTIAELKRLGLEPKLDILAHQLPDEETAFRIETAVIDVMGLQFLSNRVRGWGSIRSGRMPLAQLIPYYAAKPVEIADPVMLIRVNRKYWHGMPEQDLYEITRGVWKVGQRRENVQYALAIFEGVVREVYKIDAWHEAGTTPYSTREPDDVQLPGRWEFTGSIALPEIRERYFGCSVAEYLRAGAQNPIAYVNV